MTSASFTRTGPLRILSEGLHGKADTASIRERPWRADLEAETIPNVHPAGLKSLEAVYVAVTGTRYSVTFVVDRKDATYFTATAGTAYHSIF
jgi:hypothetical protein